MSSSTYKCLIIGSSQLYTDGAFPQGCASFEGTRLELSNNFKLPNRYRFHLLNNAPP